MTKSVLLTLGRLPKGLELARALHRSGCRVVVADPFRNHLSKPSNAVARSYQVTAPVQDRTAYVRDLLQIIENEQIDLVIPVSEEAIFVSLIEAHLPSHVTLFCASHGTLRSLHDKLHFANLSRGFGLAAPETYPADSSEALRLSKTMDFVLKPVHGCSGNGLHLCRQGDPIPDGGTENLSIVQARIHGREVSSFSIAREGRVLGTILYEGLVFAGTVATCFRRVDDLPDAKTWIETFVRETGYTGPIAFDFIVDGEGTPFAIECNPRLTSGIHFMDHDSLAAAILSPATGGPIGVRRPRAFQEGHTTLTEAYGSILRPRKFLSKINHMRTARDVLFDLRDPLPFVLMTPMSWTVLKAVLFKGLSFGEAATQDIEWHEPNSPPAAPTPDSSPMGYAHAPGT